MQHRVFRLDREEIGGIFVFQRRRGGPAPPAGDQLLPQLLPQLVRIGVFRRQLRGRVLQKAVPDQQHLAFRLRLGLLRRVHQLEHPARRAERHAAPAAQLVV